MTNWRAVGIGFLIELFLGIVGLLVPGIGQLVAGLIGGFVAGYLGSTTVRGGLWHGLLAGSLGGFFIAIPVGIVVAVASIEIGLTTQFWSLIAGVGVTMVTLLVAVVLGANSAIGGAIGGLVKKEYASPRNSHRGTAVHKESNQATTDRREGRAVSNPNHEESSTGSKLTDVVQNRR